MRVLINVISIREGGSKVVFLKLLEQFLKLEPDWEWFIAANDILAISIPEHPRIHVVSASKATTSPLQLLYWYEVMLPRLAREFGVDIVYSQTNYLPIRDLPCPTLLLEQHAGHFSPIFKRLMEAQLTGPFARALWRLKGMWVRSSLRRASRVTVQTAALAKRISAATGIALESIAVIPHGPGLVLHADANCKKPGETLRIGCITKIGVQKDFATVFRALRILRDKAEVRLVLSLDSTTKEFSATAEQMHQAGIEDLVENHGEIAPGEIEALYDSLDVAVFSSLCESFGFPLVESMARGIPVVAADIESTREIAADGVVYFPAGDHEQLAIEIMRLVEDNAARESIKKQGIKRARAFDWASSAKANLNLIRGFSQEVGG